MPTLSEMQGRNDKILDRYIGATEREVIRNYAAALDDINAQMAKLYAKYAAGDVLTLAEMTKYNRLQALDKFIRETMRPMYLSNERLMGRLGKVEYEEAFYRTAWAIDQDAGVALIMFYLRKKVNSR